MKPTPRPLHAVPQPERCDGTYTCPCKACRTEVTQRIAAGIRPRRHDTIPTRRAA